MAISLPEKETPRQWAKKEINLFVIDDDLAILRKGIAQPGLQFRGGLARPG